MGEFWCLDLKKTEFFLTKSCKDYKLSPKSENEIIENYS